ncbi:hypothetical protein [Hymenobacter ruber]
MDTPTSSLPPDNDHRPLDQQDRAAAARLNPNDPAVTAGSPGYGSFGHAANTPTNEGPGRSGANDNPDEFSEFADREEEALNAPDNPEDQPGHVTQNQNPELVRQVQAEGGDNEELRKAWAEDDPRYAGGGTHNTREEPADANYPTKDE